MIIRRGFLLGLLGLPVVSSAHHAIAGNYDTNNVIEVEGEVTGLLWRNPHVQVSMTVIGEDGNPQQWEMATTSLSNIRRWQIEPNFIEVGDTIRVAGNPAIRTEHGLYISHVLTDDQQEVLLAPNLDSRWTDRIIQAAESRRLGIGDPSAPELGIFRVWSHPDGTPTLIPRNIGQTATGRANLTEAALQASDSFVWARDNPLQDCALKGMPLIMHAPYPAQFLRDGEDILWHQEEYDTIRRIHMAPDASADGQPDSLYGYSIGRWEDERTLVVTTTNMNWGHLNGSGVPLSTSATAVERFMVTPQGDRLNYTMTVTDPVNLIEPMTFTRYWVYFPDAQVEAYDCLLEAED
ncbi:MAG: DUF6152 family protein [Gammaproteobacteria bacterium]|nr:DUF6152 family protein [Gammaproteobacteria bacterium]MDH3508606.1 DUF6152 family protein [Gammaproteobacteria bacterium]